MVRLAFSPPWAIPFIARVRIREQMRRVLDERRQRGETCLMYVHGLEGIGVSCLASQFSKDNREVIDGPLIWLVGRQPDGSAIPVGELLRLALLGLGVAESDQSASDHDRAASYQRVSRGREFVLVVDDLVNPAQIRNLIPRDAPRAVIVATGQFENRHLRQERFVSFAPELLTPGEARQVLDEALGDTAHDLEESARAELADRCGGFPLSLKVLAAQIGGRPRIATRMLTALRDSRLEVLSLDPEQRMSRFLDVTYSNLAPEQQQMYRRLALLPSAQFTISAAVAALGTDPDATADVIEELVDYNLIIYVGDDRYSSHEVVRGHARGRAYDTDESDVRDEILLRALTWNLRELLPRAITLSGRWFVAPLLDLMAEWYGEDLPTFERSEVLVWFEAETPGLVACIRQAHKLGQHDLAWMTAVALYKYLHQHGYHAYWLATHQDALKSAEAVRNLPGVMQVCLQLGAGHLAVGELDLARNCFQRALAVATDLRHVLGLQSSHEWLGKVEAANGRPAEALSYYRKSWLVVLSAGDQVDSDQRQRVRALLRLQEGRAFLQTRDWIAAEEAARAAAQYFDLQDNETDNSAKARLLLGRALLGADRAAEAVDELRQAVTLFDDDKNRRAMAEARRWLAEALVSSGHTSDAIAVLRSALAYNVEIGSPDADSLRVRLSELNQGDS